MIRLFLSIAGLFRTLGRGLREDPEFRAMGVLLLALLACGTVFYRFAEGWGVVDALYFCVMTMATVGYGDFVPRGVVSKIFTIGFTFSGIGLFASFVGKLASLWMRHHQANRSDDSSGK